MNYLQKIELMEGLVHPNDLYVSWETELGVSGTLQGMDADDANWTFDLASPNTEPTANKAEFSSEGMFGWSNPVKAGNTITTNFNRMYYANNIQPDHFIGFRKTGDLKSVSVKLQKASGITILNGYIQSLGGGPKLFFAIRLNAGLTDSPLVYLRAETGFNGYVGASNVGLANVGYMSVGLNEEVNLTVNFLQQEINSYSASLGRSAIIANNLAYTLSKPANYSANLQQSWKNVWNNGVASIEGVTTIENIPGARQVRLYDKSTGQLLQQTFSNAVGQYIFNNVDATREYFVVAHDHLRVYNGVISDMLTP